MSKIVRTMIKPLAVSGPLTVGIEVFVFQDREGLYHARIRNLRTGEKLVCNLPGDVGSYLVQFDLWGCPDSN
jgi:hypothetical protein